MTGLGFATTPEVIVQTARDVGEHSIISRAGGAPTLAVGMAHIISSAVGGKTMMAFWYHFAILFEALFILTAVDAGTRACRFMVQDLIGLAAPAFKRTDAWGPSIAATAIAVGAWGYFLYQGVTDPLGGINTLWPLFGISNQMLAAVALTLCTVVIFKMKRERYAFVTIVPTVWLCICTLTAGYQKIFSADPKIGFLAHADRYASAAAAGKVLAPAKDAGQMSQIILNDRIDAVLAALFIGLVIAIAAFGIMACLKAWRADRWTALETDPRMAAAE